MLALNSINVAMILSNVKSLWRGRVMDLVAAFVIAAATSLERSWMINDGSDNDTMIHCLYLICWQLCGNEIGNLNEMVLNNSDWTC